VIALIVFAVPLSIGSKRVVQEQVALNQVEPPVTTWANGEDTEVNSVALWSGTLEIVIVEESWETPKYFVMPWTKQDSAWFQRT